jgi:hypothetical protein
VSPALLVAALLVAYSGLAVASFTIGFAQGAHREWERTRGARPAKRVRQ